MVYDRAGDAEYLQSYTATIGQMFFEFVERRGGYDGYGGGERTGAAERAGRIRPR